MGVTRLDKIRNDKICQTLGLNHTIIELIILKQMKFFAHIQQIWQITDIQRYSWVHTLMEHGQKEDHRWTEKNENIEQ